MELSSLHDADKHKDKASPSENDLNKPTEAFVWESWKSVTRAIRLVPKPTAITLTWPNIAIAEWWVRSWVLIADCLVFAITIKEESRGAARKVP